MHDGNTDEEDIVKVIEIAIQPGECDYGWHTWIDTDVEGVRVCECGVKRHEYKDNYWYSRGM